MTKKTRALAEYSAEQLIDIVNDRVASGEISLPPIGGPFPWPPICPYPWPPYCPICGASSAVDSALGVGRQPAGGLAAYSRAASAPSGFAFRAISQMSLTIVTQDQIDKEFIRSMRAWKKRFADVELSTKLEDLAASGNGRYDVISAVQRSDFFQALGVNLFPHHMAGDANLEDVAETIGKLIEEHGHVVQP